MWYDIGMEAGIMNILDRGYVQDCIRSVSERAFTNTFVNYEKMFYSTKIEVVSLDVINTLSAYCQDIYDVSDEIRLFKFIISKKEKMLAKFYLLVIDNYFGVKINITFLFKDIGNVLIDAKYDEKYKMYENVYQNNIRHNFSSSKNKTSIVCCDNNKQYIILDKMSSGFYLDSYAIQKGSLVIRLNFDDFFHITYQMKYDMNRKSSSYIPSVEEPMNIMSAIQSNRCSWIGTELDLIKTLFTEEELEEYFAPLVTYKDCHVRRRRISFFNTESTNLEITNPSLDANDIDMFHEYAQQNIFGNCFSQFENNKTFTKYEYNDGVVFKRGNVEEYFIKTKFGYIRCRQGFEWNDAYLDVVKSLKESHTKKMFVIEKLCGRKM